MKLVTSLTISATLVFGISFVNLGLANATDASNSNSQNGQSKIESVNQPQRSCAMIWRRYVCW